jgi:hypothetical protein
MYESKREPGRKFGSSFVGKRFDSYEGGEQPGEENQNEHSHSQVVGEHGPAHQVVFHHDHEKGEHKVTSYHSDGHRNESVHSSAAEAHEAGGELANTDVKRREHPDQQSAEPEEMNYMAPETA